MSANASEALIKEYLSSFVQREEFIARFGPAYLSEDDQFGDRALVVNFGDHHITFAFIPGADNHATEQGVYLKTSPAQNGSAYLEDAPNFIKLKPGQEVVLEYKLIRIEWLIQDPKNFNDCFMHAVQEAKQRFETSRTNNQISSIHFNKAHKKLLQKVGIKTIQDIEEIGVCRTYLDVKKIGQIKESFLCNLYGAISGIHPSRVSPEVQLALQEGVRQLSMSDLRNHINMNDEVIDSLREIGFETMEEIRKKGIEEVARLLLAELGADRGSEIALAVYAATLKTGGVSVEHLDKAQLFEFDALIYDLTTKMRVKQTFQTGLDDGVKAMVGILSSGRFKNRY
ncbi:TfoX/Sxy family DNA transformation protein [Vibrio mediterranei]|uniref:TfoX/Sxy family DNA transformation protein n=1 Tax=Vibrio mediterranei TaxID=689 RepID=UPI004068BAE4